MLKLKAIASKWLWEHRVFDWSYSSPYTPNEIELRLKDALLNGRILLRWERGFSGTVSSKSFKLHYVDGGDGRSVNLNGTIHSSAGGSIVHVTCEDSSDEQRMFMVVVVFIASIMTLGLGYPRYGALVIFAPLVYWIAQLVILRSIFNQDLPVTLRALTRLLDLQPIDA